MHTLKLYAVANLCSLGGNKKKERKVTPPYSSKKSTSIVIATSILGIGAIFLSACPSDSGSGGGVSAGVCNTTVTVGASAITCTITKETVFTVTVGTKINGLVPVYQYTLGTNVEIASIQRGSAVLPQARYLTTCPTGSDTKVDLNPVDSNIVTTSICDKGYTLLVPTNVGDHRIALRPASGNSATLNLRVKDTGLTQLPYGADTQVGPTFTKYWYYMPIAVGSTRILQTNMALKASGTGNAIIIDFLLSQADNFTTSIGSTLFSHNMAVGSTIGVSANETIFATNAILLLRIQAFSQSAPATFTPTGLSNRFTLRFCNDSDNNHTCD